MVRKYKGSREEYEQKLGRVMGRLGVQVYDYDWSRRGCWVQMVYAGRAYRFENSVDKSAESGRLSNVTDLFAQISARTGGTCAGHRERHIHAGHAHGRRARALRGGGHP